MGDLLICMGFAITVTLMFVGVIFIVGVFSRALYLKSKALRDARRRCHLPERGMFHAGRR